MPVVHWSRYRYARWLLAGAVVLATLVLWAESRAGNRVWSAQIYLVVLPVHLVSLYANACYVLAGGVLTVVRSGGVAQRVPLAVTEVRREGDACRLRWTDGRRQRSLRLKLPAPFAAALERSAGAARAGADQVPVSAAAAAQAIPLGFSVPPNLGRWLFLWTAAIVALFGLAIWLNQPLLLLPLAVPVWSFDRLGPGRVLLRLGDHLWVLRPEADPYPLPLTAVQAVTPGIQVTRIATADPAWPELRLNSYQSNDLLKHLKRRLRGEPSSDSGQVAPVAGTGLRCTLCGRSVPGAPGAIAICDLCAGRTRLEAVDAGHGLTAREPKPM